MESSVLTKRLHISGLGPSLTTDDLTKRLSTFGTIKAVDGFGKVDGLGQPRTFGYVTLETTGSQLARCRNVLSGSTWKGARLRIGDAKPDYKERLEKERNCELPAKKRRVQKNKYAAVEAEDMEVVGRENVESRKGWVVTPTGRLLRPMRMRPARPLPPPTASAAMTKGKRREVTRARRMTIDTRRWEGRIPYLKGALLAAAPPLEQVNSEEDEVALQLAPQSESSPTADDLAQEKQHTLGVLASLFDGDDWGGPESVGSDIDIDEVPRVSVTAGEDDIEIVKQPAKSSLKDIFREQDGGFSLGLEFEMDEDTEIPGFDVEPVTPAAPEPVAVPIPVSFPTTTIVLDPKKPLFFPLQSSFSSGGISAKGRSRDFFDVAREKGWVKGFGSTAGFHRTGTAEEIRAKWEENKGELTSGWKRRCKEAKKVKRRRGGGHEDAEQGR